MTIKKYGECVRPKEITCTNYHSLLEYTDVDLCFSGDFDDSDLPIFCVKCPVCNTIMMQDDYGNPIRRNI